MESRTQGSRPRPRTQKISRPRTKDTDASVLQKKGLQNFFSGDLYLKKPKERSLQIFRKVSGVFQRNFNGSKIVLSSSRGQGNFRGLEASRPRTSKCVLENVLEAKDVLKDSTSGNTENKIFIALKIELMNRTR